MNLVIRGFKSHRSPNAVGTKCQETVLLGGGLDHPLNCIRAENKNHSGKWSCARMARERSAKPPMPVRIRSGPQAMSGICMAVGVYRVRQHHSDSAITAALMRSWALYATLPQK